MKKKKIQRQKKPKRSKRFKWLRAIKNDDRLWKMSFLSLLNSKITIEEFEALISGRFITSKTFGSIVWMILRVAERQDHLEQALRNVAYAQHICEKTHLRYLDLLERAIREAT